MTESRIQVGMSQEYLETTKITNDVGEVHREGVFLGDPLDEEAKTKIRNVGPGVSDYGAVVRPIMNLDAFGRLRTSNPTTLFDSQLEYDAMDLVWDAKLVTGGTYTHDADGSFVAMNTTTASGSSTIRQSPYQRYQPGKSQLALITFDFVETLANCRKRVGYFDGANGCFFELDGSGVSITLRSSVTGSVVDNQITQANWNQDKLDGTGASGITLDPTKSQIFFVDFEWLGVGTVRAGFVINGAFVFTHYFQNANNISKTYMTTANLPVRYEITNTGTTASNGLMRQICCSVQSEGGFEEDFGFKFGAGTGTTQKASTGTTDVVPLVSIRPKATFNSLVVRALILPVEYSVYAEDNAAFVQAIYNGTLSGTPSWVSTDPNSMVEYDISATGVSGGIEIGQAYAAAGGVGSGSYSSAQSGSVAARYPLSLDIDGANPTIVTLCFTSMSATSNASGNVGWKEIR